MTLDLPPVERDHFFDALRRAAQLVSVITTDGTAGRSGITVSSTCSVTADPPTMLACIHTLAPACRAVIENGCFCINILAAGHRLVADGFAGRVPELKDNKFSCAEWETLVTGAPVLKGALAALDCTVTDHRIVGSHAVIVGLVAAVVTSDAVPLVYSNRAYRYISAEPFN